MAAGFAAGSHVDLVLSKLTAVAKQDCKKSSSFLDFFKVSACISMLSVSHCIFVHKSVPAGKCIKM